jgi:hypothetical protein
METRYKIYAETPGKEFTLMNKFGRCPIIGQVYYAKQYQPNGICNGLKVVEFDFNQDGNHDTFTFDADFGRLLFGSVSLSTPSFITDAFRVFLQNPSTAEALAESIQGLYTMKLLGF